MIFAIGNHIHL